ncbi:MAG: lipoprotein N-acyltransferase Lnb domain-containing protein [Gemmatimonadales bacterium]
MLGLVSGVTAQPSSRSAAQPPSRRAAEPPSAERPAPSLEPGSELTVTLITYETGARIYERYGHNAIWIHDASTGTDDHYDYGRFSFEQPHFVLRFVEGRMWYAMGYESNVAGMVDLYLRQGRRIWMQELNIPPAERLKLREFLNWNYRPENRNYAYDYYRDNCSTRIRDALDRALGGAIRRYGEAPSGWTWRDETRRLNQHNPALYTALLVMLGEPVDAEMSRWEQMFLPARLREALSQARVRLPDGTEQPAVLAERLVAEGGQWPVPERPATWLPWYLVAGLGLGGLMALVARTRAFVPVAVLWSWLVGLLGAFMLWVWVFSYHVAGYRNENLLLFNLFVLALAIVLPAAARGRPWAVGPARWLAAAVAGLGVLGLFVTALPAFPQHNLEVFALVLPVHLAVGLGVRQRVGVSE